MKCLVKQLEAEINNSNLPILDTTVADYIKAIGNPEYEDAVLNLYTTLKTLDAVKYFDAIMPILGDTADKAVLNLLDASKFYSYPDDLSVDNNVIVSAGSTTLIEGNMPEKSYGLGESTIIAVFKNPTSGSKSIIKSQIERIGVTSGYIINYGNWHSVTPLSENEAYLCAIFPRVNTSVQGEYVKSYMLSDKFSQTINPSGAIDSYATISTNIDILAGADTLFVAILNKDLVSIGSVKAQGILDVITTFLSDVKGVTIHQNS